MKLDTMMAFDVAIVGTGMGGATLGYALARRGLRVAFIEKGHGDFPLAVNRTAYQSEDPDIRIRNGIWPTPVTGTINGVQSRFHAPLGCGAGGSSLIYAAALGRLHPADFAPRREPAMRAGWPLSYQELQPFYQEAEALFRVCGTVDPLAAKSEFDLRPPPPLTECDAHFFAAFEAAGLHPYRLHVGIDYHEKCEECPGYICERRCKSDARLRCLLPALETGNAVLIDRCEIERIEAGKRLIKALLGHRQGQPVKITASIFVLAAGAYFTPALLLKSASAHWPDGVANRSGMVGKNLMFHLSNLIALWPRQRYAQGGPRKALAFRDFYIHEGKHFGEIQSTGFSTSHKNIEYFLTSAFDRSPLRWCKPLRPLLRIPAMAAAKVFGKASVFATIMEDQPYPENRIELSRQEPSGIHFHYRMHTELLERDQAFRALLKAALRPHRYFIINREPMLNYGHPCGTCRAGNDPETSVVDKFNKAHDLANLYIADASFMPSSGGTNPALTIAANALRVAARIADVLKAKSATGKLEAESS